MLAHVVGADDRRPALVRGHGRTDRGCDAAGPRAGQHPERALPREPDQDRPAECGKLRKPSDELDVLLDGLAEADARVKADELLADSGLDGEGEAFLEEGGDVRDDIVVGRVDLDRGAR